MLNKDITFIYMDKAEWDMYQPLAEEARKRGYKVTLTDDKFKRCEIGFYCQHINFPQFSKFSVIMLHDIIQQYSNWPNLWFNEPWNKYDIGILPSQQWVENWNQCSQWYYARPRIGMYKIGWPKADVIVKLKGSASREYFYQEHNLDLSKKTIVYAPAWENDHKQDDFVQAMLKLDVNILIKQAKWSKDYPQIIRNIEEMYELHKDNPRVIILPPETNIFEAIAVSDVLVSEESSTMCEAAMMGIPAVSVSNWLIPDTTPSRYPECDYDFVIMTTKEDLTGCVRNIVENYEDYRFRSQEFAARTFSNIGNTSSMILDIIDDCVYGREIRYEQIPFRKNESIGVVKEYKRRRHQLSLAIKCNYQVRYKSVRSMMRIVQSIRHLFRPH